MTEQEKTLCEQYGHNMVTYGSVGNQYKQCSRAGCSHREEIPNQTTGTNANESGNG